MQVVARPEIFTNTNKYSFLLQYITSKMSNPFTIDHFGTLYFCLFCWPLFSGVSCAFAHIISQTLSWLQHGIINSQTALSLTHCILHRHQLLKPSLVVKCSVLPPSVILLCYMTTLVRKQVSINSILFDTNKHPYRNINRSLKPLIGSCADLNVDSGSESCSNLAPDPVRTPAPDPAWTWLRILFELRLRILLELGSESCSNSGSGSCSGLKSTPALWSSLARMQNMQLNSGFQKNVFKIRFLTVEALFMTTALKATNIC